MIDRDRVREALSIIWRGRKETTWYKEKANEYNEALDIVLNIAQSYLDGTIVGLPEGGIIIVDKSAVDFVKKAMKVGFKEIPKPLLSRKELIEILEKILFAHHDDFSKADEDACGEAADAILAHSRR